MYVTWHRVQCHRALLLRTVSLNTRLRSRSNACVVEAQCPWNRSAETQCPCIKTFSVQQKQCLCDRNTVPVQQKQCLRAGNTVPVQQKRCLCSRNTMPVQQKQCACAYIMCFYLDPLYTTYCARCHGHAGTLAQVRSGHRRLHAISVHFCTPVILDHSCARFLS